MLILFHIQESITKIGTLTLNLKSFWIFVDCSTFTLFYLISYQKIIELESDNSKFCEYFLLLALRSPITPLTPLKHFFRNHFLLSRSFHLLNCSFNTFLIIILSIGLLLYDFARSSSPQRCFVLVNAKQKMQSNRWFSFIFRCWGVSSRQIRV